MIETWGQLRKSQVDNEMIEGAISRMVDEHNNEPSAHLEEGQSLKSHRASEIIDHVARSIVNDKIIEVARAYTATVKIPSFTTQNIFFGGVDYAEQALVVVSPTKTIAEIFGRVDSLDDSEYVYCPVNMFGYNYFMTLPAIAPLNLKLYKAKLKFRAKLINSTVPNDFFEVSYGDGNTEGFTITNQWSDFEYTFYTLEHDNGLWLGINQDTLDRAGIGLNVNQNGADPTKNLVAISKMYLEIAVIDDVDSEDFCNIFDAVHYVNQLGGGSIFVKNGLYECQNGRAIADSFVDIYGESLHGCVLNSGYGVDTIQFGGNQGIKYSAGTITLTQNSAVVVASGVTWTSLNTVGKYFRDSRTGHYYPIISWQDSTHITLGEVYQGATASSIAYVIILMKHENSLHDMTLQTGVSFYGSINGLLENVDVVGGDPTTIHCENLIIRDCDISGMVATTIKSYISNSKYIDNTIKNCSLTPFNLPINCIGNLFDDNLFIDNKGQCLLIYGSSNIIKGNVLRNNGWTLGQLYSPILLGNTSSKNIISNNNIQFCNSYGIGSQSGANYNLVIGNIVINNQSVGIVNNGANSVTASNIV